MGIEIKNDAHHNDGLTSGQQNYLTMAIDDSAAGFSLAHSVQSCHGLQRGDC